MTDSAETPLMNDSSKEQPQSFNPERPETTSLI
jgi:hypothetical protein